MSVYTYGGESIGKAYDLSGASLQSCYTIDGTQISLSDDYDHYDTELQHAILTARDEWKTQYRNDSTVIPLVIHTDQHNKLRSDNAYAKDLFEYLSLAIKWNEVSACIGLGDVDMGKSSYVLMQNALSPIPRIKQINIWGNHDLWQNSTSVDGQFVIDFDTVYPYFNNESYGDVSHAYSHKGIEYHIDRAHGIKYVCIAGWEIDSSFGGHSHYVISQQSMADIVSMFEEEDGYDIVIVAHESPFANGGNTYQLSDHGETSDILDALYDQPVVSTGRVTEPVVNAAETTLDAMIYARNAKTSGTIKDSYGNTHSYDFTNCTGNIVCALMGHGHMDKYGYSKSGGFLGLMYDAFAYQHHPFYLVNIDRTNNRVDCWKITDDALVQKYSAPLKETAS